VAILSWKMFGVLIDFITKIFANYVSIYNWSNN
jgi:hypothetical protein